MICKGTTHNNGVRLAAYLTRGKDGERAELWQLRGFEATNIKDAFRDVHVMADGTRCEQPFFHVQVRNREGETLNRRQWEDAADRIEKMLGLTDQPRAIAFHMDEKSGEEHMHVAWSRIDEESLTAKPVPFFKDRLKKLSRELELHFSLEPVTSKREGEIKYAPTRAQEEQARRLGLDIHAVRNTIRACYDRSDGGASFRAALENEGMILAQGERRDFLVVDQAGGLHALGKRLLDVSAAKLRERLSDIEREKLPTVAAGRELINQQEMRKEGQKIQEVWDRDLADQVWLNAVIDASLAKDNKMRDLHSSRKGEAASERRQKEGEVPTERPLDGSVAAIRLAYSLSRTPQEFLQNLHECGFRMARVTAEEASRSHRVAAFAKEAGRFSAQYGEGEFVVINDRGHVYSLNARSTGESRGEVQAYLGTLPASRILGVEATRRDIAEHKRPAHARELWERDNLTVWQTFDGAAAEHARREGDPEHRKGYAGQIFTAYNRSDSARAFVRALGEHDLTVAIVTREDVTNCNIDRHYATDLSRSLPRKLREGDFVAVAGNGRVYNFNTGTTGDGSVRVQKFLGSLDRNQFAGVYETLDHIKARAALRDIERQAFRDLTQKKRPPRSSEARVPEARTEDRGKPIGPVKRAETAATKALGRAFDSVSNAFESLFAPPSISDKSPAHGTDNEGQTESKNAVDHARHMSQIELMREEAERRQDRERGGGGRER